MEFDVKGGGHDQCSIQHGLYGGYAPYAGQVLRSGGGRSAVWRRQSTICSCRERERERRGSAAEPPISSAAGEVDSADGLTSTISATRTGGTWSTKYQMHIGGTFSQDIRHWDVAPPKEYFDELARVSKNQIIWGGNYFDLPPTRCFLVWRKSNIPLDGFTMAPIEYAWTSFNANAKMFEAFSSGGSGREERFHPTQKPVALYEWILTKFAHPGDRILDTHLGSGSSRIAAYNLGFDFEGYEIDKEYFDKQEERFAAHTAQMSLF